MFVLSEAEAVAIPALAAIVETRALSVGLRKICSTPMSGRRPDGAYSLVRSSALRVSACAL